MTSMKAPIQDALGTLSTCSPPTAPLKYLPNYTVANNNVRAALENPPFEHRSTRVAVEALDAKVADLVATTFNFVGEGNLGTVDRQAGWYHESKTGGCGCPDPFTVGDLQGTQTVTTLTTSIGEVKSALEQLRNEIQNSGGVGGTWYERISNKYVDNLAAAEEATEALSEPLQAMITSTNTMAQQVFGDLRGVIREIREDLDFKLKDVNGNDVRNPDGNPDGIAASWLSGEDSTNTVTDPSVGTPGGMRAATDARPVLTAAMNEADDSVAAYSTALSAWVSAMQKLSFKTLEDNSGTTKYGDPNPDDPNPEDPAGPEPLDPGIPPGLQDPGLQDPNQSRVDDLQRQIDELINAKEDDQLGNPFGDLGGLGGGDPLGGLGGLGGGNPLGGLGGLGGGESPFGGASTATDPFAEELFSEPEGDEDEDEDTDEDEEEKDAEEEEEAEEEVDPKSLEDPFAPVAEPLPGEPLPGEPLPGEPLIPGTEAVVANPPIDPAAGRTVDVGGGRSVEFPNARIADTVRNMVDAEPQNPKSVYMAASEAGVNLPPMGQDIGSQVPPSLLREGDVVSSTGGNMGVYLGNGDVLMESGETKPLGEVSTFDGPNQGYFRLDTGELSGAGASESLSSPAQTVGAIEPEQTPIVENQGGTPGMPTDEDITVGDTSSGAALAQESGVTGLDPGAAFSS